MEIVNHTPFKHLLFRSILDEQKTVVSIAVRVCYKLHGQKMEVADPDDDLKLSKTPWTSTYGPMESDMIFRRRGADLSIYGHAYADRPGKTRASTVKFFYNRQLKAELNIFGERHWEKGPLGLQISQADVFDRVPLSLSNAYGGQDDWDGLTMPYSNNPHGKGYYLSKQRALNSPLPNLEFQNWQVKKWDDRPDPSGFGQFPMCQFRFNRGLEWDSDYNLKRLKPDFFNTSAPDLILENVNVGDEFMVTGASANQEYTTRLPSHRFGAAVTLGRAKFERPMYIDQIGLIPEETSFFVTYRYHFIYEVNKLEKRIVEIKNM